MTTHFTPEDLITKLIVGFISRFLYKKFEPVFNNPNNYKLYIDSLEAALTLALSTCAAILTILLTLLTIINGFTLFKLLLLLLIASFAIKLFIKHKKIVNAYR